MNEGPESCVTFGLIDLRKRVMFLVLVVVLSDKTIRIKE